MKCWGNMPQRHKQPHRRNYSNQWTSAVYAIILMSPPVSSTYAVNIGKNMAQEQRPAGIHGGIHCRGSPKQTGNRNQNTGVWHRRYSSNANNSHAPVPPARQRVACDVREMQLNHAAKYFRDCYSHKGTKYSRKKKF